MNDLIIFNKNFKQTITDHKEITDVLDDYANELEEKVHNVFIRLWSEDE